MFQIFHEIYVLLRLAGIHFFGLFGRAGVEVLIEGLNESDERIVKLAEDKLKHMGSKAMPALIKALNSKNTLIQSRSAKLLGNIGPETVSSLSQAMNSENEFVRLESISALGLLGQKTQTAIPSLILALKDPALSIRKQAKSTLKSIGRPAQESLLDTLQRYAKTDKELSYQISGVLSGFGKNTVGHLIALIKKGDNDLLPYVMRSLRLIGYEAVPELITLLQDENSQIRLRAAKTLEMMDRKAKDTIPALCTLLDDPDENVRFRAGFALGVIGADPSMFAPVLEKLSTSLGAYEAYRLYLQQGTYDSYNPFTRHSTYWAHITEEHPIIGEIVYDRLARRSICPEKDDRGGPGGCIELKGVVIRTARYGGDLVKISGFYERESGLLVTSVSDAE